MVDRGSQQHQPYLEFRSAWEIIDECDPDALVLIDRDAVGIDDITDMVRNYGREVTHRLLEWWADYPSCFLVEIVIEFECGRLRF